VSERDRERLMTDREAKPASPGDLGWKLEHLLPALAKHRPVLV
jgi:hypothetical protein